LTHLSKKIREDEKILLAVLPFGVPLIPPMGISCLKTYLLQNGYENVKLVDVILESGFKTIYDKYFETLKGFLPENKKFDGHHFYDIGDIVLQHQMMTFLNCQDERQYGELVKKIIYHTFYIHVTEKEILELNNIIEKFFSHLENYLTQILDKEKPAVLGLSVYNNNLPASFFAAKLARKIFPKILTVMGGNVFVGDLEIGTPSFGMFLEKTTDFVDKIIIGEGEILFLKLLRGEFPDSQKIFTKKDINESILQLSSVRTPDFSDFNLSDYPCIGAYTSRSCPFQCSFCAETMAWGKYRKKEVNKCISEFIELFQKYGKQLFFLTDSLLNPLIDSLSEALIESGHSFYWDGYLRADKHVCCIENTIRWRRAGFYRARMGLESGSQNILDLMGKKITVEQSKKALKCLAHAGIKTTTFWIIGHPGETEADFLLTLNFLEEMKDNIYEAICIPFRYSIAGQVNSNEWFKNYKAFPLYPQESISQLIVQPWVLQCEPSREETYNRAIRFLKHCNDIGIPSPFYFSEVLKTENRWKMLQPNAVPSQAEFINGHYLEENKNVQELITYHTTMNDDGDFKF
jgi:radical SAM superfamily enzyme YgiQ (UPF0313 family)